VRELFWIFHRRFDHGGDIHGCDVQFDLVGIELGHFGGFADQAVERSVSSLITVNNSLRWASSRL